MISAGNLVRVSLSLSLSLSLSWREMEDHTRAESDVCEGFKQVCRLQAGVQAVHVSRLHEDR